MCTSPLRINGNTFKCRQCIECRLAYSREWAIRMQFELREHASACFLTLTYDDQHLPLYGQLIKKDLQVFFKRLRHHCKFRYVACGEYGEGKLRPHFHVCVFGQDFRKDSKVAAKSKSGMPQWFSPLIDKVWGLGRHTIGTFTFESAAYTSRYILKKVRTSEGHLYTPVLHIDPSTGEIIFANSEFLLASRKPPIGVRAFTWLRDTDVLPEARIITTQGTPAPIPRAFKDIMRTNAGDNLEYHRPSNVYTLVGDVSIESIQYLEMRSKILDNFFDNRNPEEFSRNRLAARAVYNEAKANFFKRST